MDIISALTKAIVALIGPSRSRWWFAQGPEIRLETVPSDETSCRKGRSTQQVPTRITLCVRDETALEAIQEHFGEAIQETVVRILKRSVTIAYQVSETVLPANEDAPCSSSKTSSSSRTTRPTSKRKASSSNRTRASKKTTSKKSTKTAKKQAASTKQTPVRRAKKKTVVTKKSSAGSRSAPRKMAGGGKKVVVQKETVSSSKRGTKPVATSELKNLPTREATSIPRSKPASRSQTTVPTPPKASPPKSRSTKSDARPKQPAPSPAPPASSKKPRSQPTASRRPASSSKSDAGLPDAPEPFEIVTGPDGKPRAVSAVRAVRGAPRGSRLSTFATFAQGPSNKVAFLGAEMAVEQPGAVSPIYFFGPPSVGKTHLLEAVLDETLRSGRRRAAVMLSAEAFTTEFLDALRNGGLPNFRSKYRTVDLLIIDDIQFFLGKRATIDEFRYMIDALLRNGKQVVLAGDRSIERLKGLGRDIITRITGGMVCPISPPELATRLEIVQHLTRRQEMNIPETVQRFIASRFTNHARELSGAICRLRAAAIAADSEITIEFAKTALDDLVRQSQRVVRLSDIDQAVRDTLGLEDDSLQSKSRTKKVAHPRMLAMWLAKKYTRSALSEIGQYFGNRAHSTVSAANHRVDSWLSEEAEIPLNDRVWRVSDAVQRIEQLLASG
jgi:chromosomal replication initiator protein